jgi:hypothetical protein
MAAAAAAEEEEEEEEAAAVTQGEDVPVTSFFAQPTDLEIGSQNE